MTSNKTLHSFITKFKGKSICNPLLYSFYSSHSYSSFSSNYNKYKDGLPPPKSVYQKVNKLDDALHLFDEMSHRKPLPSVIKFTQLLNSVTKMNHFSHSIHLFNHMCAIGVPVNDYTVNIAIKCCCHLRRTNDGFALLGFCFRRGIVPDLYTFSTLLDGLVLEDRIIEAEIFFKKLIKQKLCEPNVVMYSTMIKGLCKFGDNVTAMSLLRLMVRKGCKPDVVSYSTIIDSLCKDQLIDDAFKLFKEMAFQKGIPPDVVTYTTLISGLCNLGRWDEVYKILKEMEDHKISPDVHTYSILVDALCKEGKAKEAEDVIHIMVEKGKEPNIVTYNSLIDGYCLRGEMTIAKTIFDGMVFKGILPDVVTYNSLLNGYCKKLMIDEALHMFSEMTRKAPKPNVVTYSTMIQGLFTPLAGMLNISAKLDDISAWLTANASNKSVASVVARLLFAASSYFVWQERNSRLFSNKTRSANQLKDIIASTVRQKLMGMKFKNTAAAKHVIEAWELPRSLCNMESA